MTRGAAAHPRLARARKHFILQSIGAVSGAGSRVLVRESVQKWLRRIRGVIGMGLLWAAGGAAIGGVIELLDNVLPGGLAMASAVDMWPQTLAVVAFRRGVLFAVVLGLARGHRRFEDFSLAQFAGLGAVAGLLLGALSIALGGGLVVAGVTTGLSAIAGAASLALARQAEARGLLDAGPVAAGAALPPDEAREPLGRGR